MTEGETGVLAARLLGVTALVLLAPGFALLGSLRVPAEWPERIVLAFSLSYSWIFILSVVVPLFGWTVDYAAVLTLVLLVALSGVASVRARKRGTVTLPSRRHLDALLVAVVVIASALAGWVIEPSLMGDEALDLASLSRFADGGPITFDNTSLLPDTRPVYLFQPYQLALGIIARWSGTDPLITFIKFRAFLAPLCLLCIYAVLRRLTLTRIEAVAAFIIVVLFVALELETWESNSLFPSVRRGSFSAGVLVPALLVLCVIATRRVQEGGDRFVRRVALGVAPVMLAASLSTHAVEMVTFLWFAAAAMVAIVTGLDRSGDRKQALVLMLALAMLAGTYLIVHSRTVSYLGQRLPLLTRLNRLVTDTGKATAGTSAGPGNLIVGSTPLTTAAVIGIPALGLAALRAPAAAAVLALGTVPLVLLYASPAGYVVLRSLIRPIPILDTKAYFMLMGVLGVALGLVALAQGVLHAAASRPRRFSQVVVGSLVLSVVLIAGREAVQWLGNYASTRPDLFLLVQTALAAAAVTIAAMRPRPLLRSAPFPGAFVILTACLAIPLAVPGLVFGGVFARENNASVFSRFQAALSRPSALDWPAYYEELKETIAPPLPVPRAVVDELRRLIPPRQILLAHPSYSCALVVLMDAYCVNPEFIYGSFFLPAARYHAEYVTGTDGQAREHPFFNPRPSLTDAEDRFLTEYRVSYLLADPEHAEQIALKLKEATRGATLEMDQDGYRLYRITGS